jgi:hypothetical protein
MESSSARWCLPSGSSLLATGQVPELLTEPYRIALHLVAEFGTAAGLIMAGIALLRRLAWARKAYLSSPNSDWSPTNSPVRRWSWPARVARSGARQRGALLWLGANAIIAEIDEGKGQAAAEALAVQFGLRRVAITRTDIGAEAGVRNLHWEDEGLSSADLRDAWSPWCHRLFDNARRPCY